MEAFAYNIPLLVLSTPFGMAKLVLAILFNAHQARFGMVVTVSQTLRIAHKAPIYLITSAFPFPNNAFLSIHGMDPAAY